MRETSLKNNISAALYQDIASIFEESYLQYGKKYLITGGTGFIASYIVYFLLFLNDMHNCGNQITLLVRNKEKAVKKYGNLLKRADLKLMEQDVCEEIRSDVRFDYIIHAASPADARFFESAPIEVFNSNVLGLENIIEFAKRNKPSSVVYLSSFTVYGDTGACECKVDENFVGPLAWNTRNACYSLGKRSAEFLCFAAHKTYHLPVKIVRPGFVYGFSSADDPRVYAEIIRRASEEKNVVLKSNGYTYRSLVYVSDLAGAVLSVLYKGKDGEAYNAAAQHASIRAFAQLAAEAGAPGTRLEFINKADEDAEEPSVTSPAMSNEKIKEECGWSFKNSLKKGIEKALLICRTCTPPPRGVVGSFVGFNWRWAYFIPNIRRA